MLKIHVSPCQSCGSIRMMVDPPGGTDKSTEEPMPMVTEVTGDYPESPKIVKFRSAKIYVNFWI